MTDQRRKRMPEPSGSHMSFRGSFAGMLAGVLMLIAGAGAAQQTTPPTTAAPARSVPLNNIRYEITFDSTTARERMIKVMMSFDVGGNGPVLLSLPAWTPGAYEVSNFAR